MCIDPAGFMSLSFVSFRRLFCVLVLLSIAAAGTVSAQDVRTITIEEAVRIALERNVALRQASNNLEAQAAQVQAERGDFLPDLGVFFRPGQSYGTSFDQTSGGFTSETTQSMSAQLQSSVTLFSGYNNVATLNQARHTLDQRDYTLERTRQVVVFDAVSIFLEMIASREQIAIQQENLESQQQQLEQIREFTRVGSRPISDLYQQEATTAQAELQLLEAERQLQLSETRLIQVLQLDPFGNYAFVVPELDENITLTPNTYQLDELLRQAFDRRADLKAQEAAIDASESAIRAARSGYFPTISFSAGISSFYSSSLTGISFSDQFFDQRRTEDLGLSVNIPLFNRFRTNSQVQQAKVQYQNARLGLETQQQEVALQVRQAYLDYQTSIKNLEVTQKQLLAAERALEAAQARYAVGATTLVELSQVQATYVQAASDRANARYTFLFREKLLEYYTGVLDPSTALTN